MSPLKIFGKEFLVASPLAHSSNDQGQAHDLAQHLQETAELAAAFATAFDSAAFARCAGLWHDLGKNALDFQNQLLRSSNAHIEGSSGRVDHSSAGAIHALEVLKTGLGLPLAFIIAGHHAGLVDKTDLDARLAGKRSRYEAALANPAKFIPIAPSPTPPRFLQADTGIKGDEAKQRYELWVRMLFSCLVDADFLDTERHFNEKQARLRGRYLRLAELKERFDRELESTFAKAPPSAVNEIRNRVRAACRAKGRHCPQGVFTLTAPTGCGKTLSGMAFALEHADEHKLDRIIVVLPFTSIIDQNAKVYRDLFGAENVLEHHASIDLDDPARENPSSRIARENWDAPIIVTTSVQFLESLLANRTSRCRKLHNIARSVVIFDEVQTLPIAHLIPILDVLKELVRAYQVTLVLSTATQPALKYRSGSLGQVFPGFEATTEIVDAVEETFSALKRVEVQWPADLQQPMSWEQLAAEVQEKTEVLVIVHKRDDARQLAQLIPESIHLSALMCPKHRLQVIEDIKAALQANHERRKRKESIQPVRVISTQLVEAGVDLDFPVVYRALAGFDSIAQAAGRCNREGRLRELGQLRVFVAPSEPPKGTPRDAKAVAQVMLAGQPNLDPLDPKVFDAYFRRLYFGRQLDERGIQALRQGLRFKTTAEAFAVIEDDGSEAVIVPFGDADKHLTELRNHGASRERLRAVQPFVVNLYPQQLQQLEKAGAVETVADIVRAIKAPMFGHLYDHRFGLDLMRPILPDPSTLITGGS